MTRFIYVIIEKLMYNLKMFSLIIIFINDNFRLLLKSSTKIQSAFVFNVQLSFFSKGIFISEMNKLFEFKFLNKVWVQSFWCKILYCYL